MFARKQDITHPNSYRLWFVRLNNDKAGVNKWKHSTVCAVNTHLLKFVSSTPTKAPNLYGPRRIFKEFFFPNKLWYRYIGKTYRLRIKPNVMFLRFNKSHKTYLLHTERKFKFFKSKGMRFWVSMLPKHLSHFRWIMELLRPRNRFTARGLWKTKTYYKKKRGKISGYSKATKYVMVLAVLHFTVLVVHDRSGTILHIIAYYSTILLLVYMLLRLSYLLLPEVINNVTTLANNSVAMLCTLLQLASFTLSYWFA